mmetsp:Transcript_1952/g.3517  ORF Transcript_1952/g.3517 Transcript_1952/m.3517 type:complete len:134 (-) Transcript_1952:20-421(-)
MFHAKMPGNIVAQLFLSMDSQDKQDRQKKFDVTEGVRRCRTLSGGNRVAVSRFGSTSSKILGSGELRTMQYHFLKTSRSLIAHLRRCNMHFETFTRKVLFPNKFFPPSLDDREWTFSLTQLSITFVFVSARIT